MIYFSVDGRITTFFSGNPSMGYPKIISSSILGHDVVVSTPEELAQVEALDEDRVIEPVKDTIITVAGQEHLIVLGRDYSSCVITTPNKTVIVGNKVNAPELEVTITAQGHPRLRWTSSFLTTTKIYRTQAVLSNLSPGEHTLIAEIDPVNVPNTRGLYTDISFGPLETGYKVSYYVTNENGTSPMVEAVR